LVKFFGVTFCTCNVVSHLIVRVTCSHCSRMATRGTRSEFPFKFMRLGEQMRVDVVRFW
jgi:hypothetical protein